MKAKRNEIFILITAISLYLCVDIFPQRAIQKFKNPRIKSTEQSREKYTQPERIKPEILDRKKEKATTSNRVNRPSTGDNVSSRGTRQPNLDIAPNRREPVEIEETRERSDTRLFGNLGKRRITPKREVHTNKPIYVERHINYSYPHYFTCRTFPLEIVNVYPHFPLRFVSANIDYLYSKKNNYESSLLGNKYRKPLFINFFEVNISVLVTEEYWQEFGVLVKYPNGREQIVLFNEKESYLIPGRIYNFSKIVALEDLGNINLRIGFYDSFDDSFYPAVYSRNKTDLSIFIRAKKFTL